MKPKFPSRRNSFGFPLSGTLLAAALYSAVNPAYAVDYIWDGGGTTDAWGNAGNWDIAGSPTFSADNGFIFYAPGASRLVNFLGANRIIGALTYNADADNDVTSYLQSATNVAVTLTLGSGTVAPTMTVASGAEGNFTIDNTAGALGSVILANNLTVTHDGSGNLSINRPITSTGTFGITKQGSGTLILSGVNTYSGVTMISGGTLQISTLADGGGNSGIGASSNAAANLVLDGGTLRYTGGTVETNRLFALRTSSIIDSSGTGAVNFTNIGNMGFSATTGNRTLTLTGTNTGDNTIAAAINDYLTVNITSLAKTGDGTWVLGGASTYTGATSVSAGTLLVNGSLGNSAVTVDGGAFGGSGAIGSTLDLLSGKFHVADLFDALQVADTLTLYAGFGIDDLAGITWESVDNGTYTLINGTLDTGVFDGLANNSLASAGEIDGSRSAYFQLQESSLQLVVIPEPRAALLGGLGLLALLRRRR
jgi:autotransporter-associated beta strand protein